jgi:hypothetical protein
VLLNSDCKITVLILDTRQITALGDIHPAEDVGVLPGDHYTMCRFQTNLDAGFSIVSRRLKLIIYGEQIPSNHFDTIKVKKTKGKMSDILESSQSYNSQ